MASISIPTALAVASTAASVGSGLMQSGQVSDAAGKSIAATQQGRDQARADLQPWVGAGQNALGITADLSGANGTDAATAAMKNYQTSPGYQWQLGEGLRAVDAGAAAKGMTRSGATLKAEQTYGAGLADQDFGQYYNRLFQLSGQGQNSAAGQASASTAAGRDIAQTDLSAGAAQASIYGNMGAGISNTANNYANQSLYGSRTNPLSSGTVVGPGGSLNYAQNYGYR